MGDDGGGSASADFLERLDDYANSDDWWNRALAGTSPWEDGSFGWWGTPHFDNDDFGESDPPSVELVDEDFDESATYYGTNKPSGRTPDNSPLAAVADDPAYSAIEVPRVRKSLRMLWPDARTEGLDAPKCQSAVPKLRLKALRDQGPFKELWVEFWMKLSPGWNTDSLSGECGRAPDWKTFFVNTNRGDGSGDKRFEIKIGTFGNTAEIGTPSPASCSGELKESLVADPKPRGGIIEGLTDGQWFRVRLHAWVSSFDGACDGGMEARIWHPDFTAHALIPDADTNGKDKITGHFEVGDTFNLPVTPEQFAYWAYFRAWTSDPGW